MDASDGCLVEIVTQRCDRARLFERCAKLRPFDRSDLLRDLVTSKATRRCAATDHGDVRAFGNFGDRGVENLVHGRAFRELVIVVEHQQRRASEELAKELSAIASEVGALLRCELRQLRRILAAGWQRLREVMEERPDVVIAGIEVIPGRAALLCIDVARDQRRLAGTRRTREPYERPLARPVDQRE
jgi:hypothetical protein